MAGSCWDLSPLWTSALMPVFYGGLLDGLISDSAYEYVVGWEERDGSMAWTCPRVSLFEAPRLDVGDEPVWSAVHGYRLTDSENGKRYVYDPNMWVLVENPDYSESERKIYRLSA